MHVIPVPNSNGAPLGGPNGAPLLSGFLSGFFFSNFTFWLSRISSEKSRKLFKMIFELARKKIYW